MSKRRLGNTVVLMLSIFMLCALVGCGDVQEPAGQPETRTVINLDGSEIIVPAEVNKVGALFGPSYEKVVLLGAEEKIVCNGDFHIDGWPWSNVIYKRLDEVPGIPDAHTALNVEEILKLEPDVIFYWNNPEEVERLQAANIAAVPSVSSPGGPRFEDCKDMLMVYAQILGEDEVKIAEEYAEYFDKKLQMVTAITSTIPEDERPKVYWARQELLMTSGGNSDVPELIDLAGGNCVHRDLPGGGKTEINMEQLLEWDPDFIFVDHAGSSGNAPAEEVVSAMVDDERFSQLTAVQQEQVKICPTGVFFWGAGQQRILLLMWMAKTLCPDKFIDLDMENELKYFYEKFFDYKLSDDQAYKILMHLSPEGSS